MPMRGEPSASAMREAWQTPVTQFQKTDVYQGSSEEADRNYPEYGFALVLICVALALVVASVMFPDAFRPGGEYSLFGP